MNYHFENLKQFRDALEHFQSVAGNTAASAGIKKADRDYQNGRRAGFHDALDMLTGYENSLKQNAKLGTAYETWELVLVFKHPEGLSLDPEPVTYQIDMEDEARRAFETCKNDPLFRSVRLYRRILEDC